MDVYTITLLTLGALTAGFVNGFAGFGTALVASGFWFLVLPPEIVPPLIVVAALAGQFVGLWKLAGRLSWSKSTYLISGGVFGVPVGTLLLTILDPNTVKMAIGGMLLCYSLVQFRGLSDLKLPVHRDGIADRGIGFVSGILGGIAGLSGVLPMIWLQVNKLSSAEQRARYQPFNLLILGFAAVAMGFVGKFNAALLPYALIAVPFSLLGAFIGVRAYVGVSENTFRQIVLGLLFLSGCVIVAQTVMG
ncbi:sulfite exporter TauE/SafE family protein [Shimia sp.]|uniref:sulfite exporter TauE/SafE family protein n=1 Tax=Shimia sp. TaxID=1954381 RepID=UPI003298FCF6